MIRTHSPEFEHCNYKAEQQEVIKFQLSFSISILACKVVRSRVYNSKEMIRHKPLYHVPGLMIMASHRTFSGQSKHMLGWINFLYNIKGNFIELVENNECPDKFWSLS